MTTTEKSNMMKTGDVVEMHPMYEVELTEAELKARHLEHKRLLKAKQQCEEAVEWLERGTEENLKKAKEYRQKTKEIKNNGSKLKMLLTWNG